jgi:transposase-like protein
MRPVCVFTDVPVGVRAQIMDLLHGRWRTATRLIMVVLSADGMSPAEIADLFDYNPATVRRWLHRFSTDGIGGLPDRPRPGPASAGRAYPHPAHRRPPCCALRERGRSRVGVAALALRHRRYCCISPTS